MGCYSENVFVLCSQQKHSCWGWGALGEGVGMQINERNTQIVNVVKIKRGRGKKGTGMGCCFCVERSRKTLLIRPLIREQKGSERVHQEGV